MFRALALVIIPIFFIACGGGNDNRRPRGERCTLNLKKTTFDPENEQHNPLKVREFKGSDKNQKISVSKAGGDDGLPEGEMRYMGSDIYIVDTRHRDRSKHKILRFFHGVSYNTDGSLTLNKNGVPLDRFSTGCVRGFSPGPSAKIAEYDIPVNVNVAKDGKITFQTRTISVFFSRNQKTKNQLSYVPTTEAVDVNQSLKDFYLNDQQMYLLKTTTSEVTITKAVSASDAQPTNATSPAETPESNSGETPAESTPPTGSGDAEKPEEDATSTETSEPAESEANEQNEEQTVEVLVDRTVKDINWRVHLVNQPNYQVFISINLQSINDVEK